MPESPIYFRPKADSPVRCAQCQRVRTRRVVRHANGTEYPVCKNCLPAFAPLVCNTCNRAGAAGYIPFLNPDGSHTCQRCAPARRLCGCCGRAEGQARGGSGSYLCDACFAAHYFVCTDCARPLRTTDRSLREPRTVCIWCWEDRHQIIKSAGCKKFRAPMGDGPLFFGVELETEVSEYGSEYQTVAKQVHDLVGEFCVLKEDGSLRNGIEIVSCPCSFEVHKTIWERLFTQKPKSLVSHQSGRCGIHIHITRAALGGRQLGRMLVLVNASENERLITCIAGRGYTDYCRRSPKVVEDFSRNWQKYEALNTCYPNTVELRIFRGTLNYRSFLKNIEFAHALVHFCQPEAVTQEDCSTPKKFLDWLAEREETYPNLVRHLQRKGWLKKSEEVLGPPEPEPVEI